MAGNDVTIIKQAYDILELQFQISKIHYTSYTPNLYEEIGNLWLS